ncbi:meiotic recombination [Pleurotus pulmonarius]|nr:meiotic recombination [Pleurotus pulmonarius]KAF4579353.1 meiotic recombination [Pleurotus pulmonarius]KAF4603316.1 meiotic recombination [Pleurotus pulmonarius]
MADSDHEGSPPPNTPAIQNAYAEDTIRIMLATDTHIGYAERDPVRGQDSINSFKEVLQLAVKHEVDFILLAGDLFHDNKPSRECLYRVMALIREYTLGEKPVQIELLSDPDEGKAAECSFPAINYEDPNFNVAIPVFSIHGNHDDPQGAGSEGALCALDMLSVSGLVNYMGKIDLPLASAKPAGKGEKEKESSSHGIAVRPVLLRKGKTRLGLYGIGNVKDARMHFELRSNRVRMFMPQDKEEWFNLMLLHQNRVKHGPQEYVPEGMFDDNIDLVVWGHEHDCRIVPEPVAGKNYYITQPGSTVATSLADGEATQKHVALVQIQGKEFQLTPIPLRSVRPFVIEEVTLLDVAEEEGFDVDDQMAITKYLKRKVNELIVQANAQWEQRNAQAIEEGEEELPKMLPLIRLKVDTTGVTEMSNPIRFGQEFAGQIANPRDVLVFHRARARRANGKGKVVIDNPELSIDDPDLTMSEKLAKVRVGTLVKEYLGAQELQVLGEVGMGDAIQMFVEKDDSHAIQSHVSRALKALLKDVQTKGTEIDEDDVEELLTKAKEQQDKAYEETRKNIPTKKGKGKAAQDDDDAPSEDSMMMDVDFGTGGAGSDFDQLSDPPPPPKKTTARSRAAATKAPTKKAPAKKAPAKKAPAKGRGKKAVEPDSDEDEIIPIDDVSEDDEEEDPPPKAPAKRTNRAAVLSQTTAAKKTPAKRKAPAASQSKQSTLAFAPAGRSSTRAAASRARGKMVVDEDSE